MKVAASVHTFIYMFFNKTLECGDSNVALYSLMRFQFVMCFIRLCEVLFYIHQVEGLCWFRMLSFNMCIVVIVA